MYCICTYLIIRIDKGIFYKGNQNHKITLCIIISDFHFFINYVLVNFWGYLFLVCIWKKEDTSLLKLKNNFGIFNTFLIYQLSTALWIDNTMYSIFWDKYFFRKIIVSSFKVDTNKGFYSMSNMQLEKKDAIWRLVYTFVSIWHLLQIIKYS